MVGVRTIAESEAAWEPSPKQRQAIVILATGETIDRTATVVGVDRRTILRWRELPEFRQAVRDTLMGVLDQAMAKFVNGVPDAVDVVNRVHRDEGKVDRDRLANAQWTIDRFRYLVDRFDAGRPGAAQSRITVSETRTVTASGPDLTRLTELLLGDRDAKRSLLIEPDDVVAGSTTTDSPPD